jgi:calcineurin-like phosphoesterase family protein
MNRVEEACEPVSEGHPLLAAFDRVLVTSDTHFFHDRLATELAPGIRPLDFHGRLVTGWQERVSADDLILHLGDVAVGAGLPAEYATRLPWLPGLKFLLPGNHDRSKSKLEAYAALGWRLVRPFSCERDGAILAFTHEPIPPEELPPNTLNVHGHIHHHVVSPWHLNCSVEHIGFAPVPLAELIDAALVAARRGDALQKEGGVLGVHAVAEQGHRSL